MIRSPSKHHSREFLAYLQANNYISKAGVEYCAAEVDQDLCEKQARLCPVEAEQAFESHWQELENESRADDWGLPPIIPTKTTEQKPITRAELWGLLGFTCDYNLAAMKQPRQQGAAPMTAAEERALLRQIDAQVRRDDRRFNRSMAEIPAIMQRLEKLNAQTDRLFDQYERAKKRKR